MLTERKKDKKQRKLSTLFALIPIVGIIVFLALYAWAASLYPGGSNIDKTSEGFNLLQNYWCDLMGTEAKNEQPNPAQPIALLAMFLLCMSLVIFWKNIPILFPENRYNRLIQITGMTSMLITVFLFTSYHDSVINVAGALSVIALLFTFISLKKHRYFKTVGLGMLCLLMSLINYFIYQTGIGLDYLALLQKLTFIPAFLWFGVLSWSVRKQYVRELGS